MATHQHNGHESNGKAVVKAKPRINTEGDLYDMAQFMDDERARELTVERQTTPKKKLKLTRPVEPDDDPDDQDMQWQDDGRDLVEWEKERVRWLWPGVFPQGKISIVAGAPDLGKSTLALDTAARVSAGERRKRAGCSSSRTRAARSHPQYEAGPLVRPLRMVGRELCAGLGNEMIAGGAEINQRDRKRHFRIYVPATSEDRIMAEKVYVGHLIEDMKRHAATIADAFRKLISASEHAIEQYEIAEAAGSQEACDGIMHEINLLVEYQEDLWMEMRPVIEAESLLLQGMIKDGITVPNAEQIILWQQEIQSGLKSIREKRRRMKHTTRKACAAGHHNH